MRDARRVQDRHHVRQGNRSHTKHTWPIQGAVHHRGRWTAMSRPAIEDQVNRVPELGFDLRRVARLRQARNVGGGGRLILA